MAGGSAQGGQPGRRGGGDKGGSRGKPSGDKSSRGASSGRGSAARWAGSRDGSKGSPRGGSTRRPRETAADRSAPRTEDQRAYDGPELPEDITGRELDRSVSAQLQGLPEKLALRVARHLVAAGLLLDEDPATAYAHARAARARASRLAVVREACGEAAYAAGEYDEALSELRAAKRMNGSKEYLPMIADCERALGRPEKALAVAREAQGKALPQAVEIELSIVAAGARRDLGELAGALRTLESGPLHSPSREEWSVRLRYAYADTLLAAGRTEEASEWFHRTAAIDGDGLTDAEERAQEVDALRDRDGGSSTAGPES